MPWVRNGVGSIRTLGGGSIPSRSGRRPVTKAISDSPSSTPRNRMRKSTGRWPVRTTHAAAHRRASARRTGERSGSGYRRCLPPLFAPLGSRSPLDGLTHRCLSVAFAEALPSVLQQTVNYHSNLPSTSMFLPLTPVATRATAGLRSQRRSRGPAPGSVRGTDPCPPPPARHIAPTQAKPGLARRSIVVAWRRACQPAACRAGLRHKNRWSAVAQNNAYARPRTCCADNSPQ